MTPSPASIQKRPADLPREGQPVLFLYSSEPEGIFLPEHRFRAVLHRDHTAGGCSRIPAGGESVHRLPSGSASCPQRLRCARPPGFQTATPPPSAPLCGRTAGSPISGQSPGGSTPQTTAGSDRRHDIPAPSSPHRLPPGRTVSPARYSPAAATWKTIPGPGFLSPPWNMPPVLAFFPLYHSPAPYRKKNGRQNMPSVFLCIFRVSGTADRHS